ncbi:pogo transposable element, putative [Talaromyces stipitatus ATCC 10500]|uniref:Pogo transposable element, putative n=1 Tax=Talaromyces stipitatus (strain ATCC 10500 / CBS 375.48 / QM 6759 / NRRL 1006) TaxID=441959 RepID=B8MSL8_TALSN|nr:pogo transposable element, putative [Talaromyces stipitatus ATCC 10500]EED12346.1 pogo transposable element, putative [Talaromyces stipitatus ATCC 10500]
MAKFDQFVKPHVLTQNEEESLLKWILDLDKRGLPPRPSLVQDMADLLLSQNGNKHVSERWVYRFVDRHPEVKLRFSRRYNYERAKCEDIKIIREHFNRVQEVIQEYGILSEDIYNFDETGFAMGLCASAKVITGSDRYGRPYLLQPGNREWVTAIEAVNSTGWALPSYVIFKATTYYQQGWFETLPQDWRLDISKNGWTTDEIGIRWLQKHFIPHTTSRTKGRYRMLILDGHGSHLTPQFDQICTENNIIPVCMPPHSSHLLQPLDVSCFAVLKRQYGRLVEQRVRLGFNHIDKYDFLTAFPEPRAMAYKAENVQNGFKATGLVPYNPDHVYEKLTVQLRTPTPPPSRSSNSQSSCQQTPQNPRQFNRQTATIKKRINDRTIGPFEVVDQAINRLSKAYEMSRNELLIIQKEVHDLRAANEKEKKKRKRSRAQISHEGSLTAQEAQELIGSRNEASQPIPTAPVESEPQTSQPRLRAPPKCSGCGIIGHKINRCPNRTTS